MATALASNTALTELHLESNTIGNMGATALATALASNTGLTNLWLHTNTIGDAGIAALAEGLAVNTTLTSLHCDHERPVAERCMFVFLRRNGRFAKLRRPTLQLMCAVQRRELFVPAEIWSLVRWALASLCEAP